MELTNEQEEAVKDAVESAIGEGDIWKQAFNDLFDPNGGHVGAALSQDSLNKLEAAGYKENKLELKIAIVNDGEENTIVYTSLDNGNTWKDAEGNSISVEDAFGAVSGEITEITYTFTHTYKAEPVPVKTEVEKKEEEEKKKEEELTEPDVPLADIPQPGDISVLWYGAALMAAAGLVILLAQERRDKKTA